MPRRSAMDSGRSRSHSDDRGRERSAAPGGRPQAFDEPALALQCLPAAHSRERRQNSALSPTGASGFHHVMRFAYLHAGLSHEFPADPSVTTYMSAAKAAAALPKAEAVAAFTVLADVAQGKLSEFQRSAALKQAAAAARSIKDFAKADELAARIPVEAERKNAQMFNLLARREASELLARFGNEDLRSGRFGPLAKPTMLAAGPTPPSVRRRRPRPSSKPHWNGPATSGPKRRFARPWRRQYPRKGSARGDRRAANSCCGCFTAKCSFEADAELKSHTAERASSAPRRVILPSPDSYNRVRPFCLRHARPISQRSTHRVVEYVRFGDPRIARRRQSRADAVHPGNARQLDARRLHRRVADGLIAGLTRLAQGEIDLVLLDLGLPESDGLQTFRRMRARQLSCRSSCSPAMTIR